MNQIFLNHKFTFNFSVTQGFLTALALVYLLQVNNSNHLKGKWGGEPLISSISNVNQRFNSERSTKQRFADYIERELKLPALQQVNSETDVIFIIADALRADHLPVYGYPRQNTPFISDLALKPAYQQIENFTATCSESACGIYSSLSSREFLDIGLGLYDLSDVLKDGGYKKYYILSANHEINSLNQLYGTNHDIYLDGASHWPKLSMYTDESVILNMDKVPEKTDAPAFFYFHFMSTHQLGKISDENKIYSPSSKDLSAFASFDKQTVSPDKIQALVNGYDNGVYQFDKYLERLFSVLSDKGYMENAIVIITGDHGEGLGERGYFYHTYQLYQEDIRVPFIMYDTSGSCTLLETDYATQIDIPPTVLDCLDFPSIDTWKGVSLMSKSVLPRYTLHQTFRGRQEIGLIKHDNNTTFKLLATNQNGTFKNYRLYELINDPGEMHNIIDSADVDLINELKQMMKQKLKPTE
ncbi:sulfatase-like hydrolase/transferase [Marinicella sp. S1101]|uniref:sulfatase-like hydrolase/transferase n=1 Tax=Marinicella marina TaxID=2996016 RepID=UPI002260CD2B|nr:sulfatase-like hydrolase/transferase [Marinicella marina]MCX7552940.1 sulfatase-like hydrolase/transferase [Marinicella marina]MDJ1139750.1 sulfatase-like hydrolase/transferase [Marinicella marina]